MKELRLKTYCITRNENYQIFGLVILSTGQSSVILNI